MRVRSPTGCSRASGTAARGGFHLTPADAGLLVRPKSFDDDDVPSGNAVAMRALQRLAVETGDVRYADAARGVVDAAAPLLRDAPSALATLVAARIEVPVQRAAGRNRRGLDTGASRFRLRPPRVARAGSRAAKTTCARR